MKEQIATARRLSLTQKGKDFIKEHEHLNDKEINGAGKAFLKIGNKSTIEETIKYLYENGYLNPEIYID